MVLLLLKVIVYEVLGVSKGILLFGLEVMFVGIVIVVVKFIEVGLEVKIFFYYGGMLIVGV